MKETREVGTKNCFLPAGPIGFSHLLALGAPEGFISEQLIPRGRGRERAVLAPTACRCSSWVQEHHCVRGAPSGGERQAWREEQPSEKCKRKPPNREQA